MVKSTHYQKIQTTYMPKDTVDKLIDDMADWMIEHGPDGHCDGADIIAGLVFDKYITTAHNKGVEVTKKEVAEWAKSNARTKDTMMSDLPENHEWTVDYHELVDFLTPLPEEVSL